MKTLSKLGISFKREMKIFLSSSHLNIGIMIFISINKSLKNELLFKVSSNKTSIFIAIYPHTNCACCLQSLDLKLSF